MLSLTDWEDWQRQAPAFARRLGRSFGTEPFPLGLWFHAENAAAALAQAGDLPAKEKAAREFAARLRDQGAWAWTLNAFPQGRFHEPVVKTKVYWPDWTQPERLAYTQDCALLLEGLLGEETFGSLSTLPLGWREGFGPDAVKKSVEHLLAWVAFARERRDRTGKTLALALEPEPGCALERTHQVVGFWETLLRPAAVKAGLAEALEVFLGVCYDCCHQAVQFEDPVRAVQSLAKAGIPVHKTQISSALAFPPDGARVGAAQREAFVEPRFLHQTRVRTPDGVVDYDDLPAALAEPEAWKHPWRTHYHLPIDLETLENGFGTTASDWRRAVEALLQGPCRHYEVETYTWSVLPEALRPRDDEALAHCLERELRCVQEAFPEAFAVTPTPSA